MMEHMEEFRPDGLVSVRFEDSGMECEFLFREMTCGDYKAASSASSVTEVINSRETIRTSNPFETDRAIVFRCLLDFSMDGRKACLERRDGWLTEDSMRKVSSLSSRIVERAIADYRKSFEMDDEEEIELSKQSHILFSGSGRVESPLEAVSLFCDLSRFSEKFNMSPSDMDDMPFHDYIRVRKILEAESEHLKTKQRNADGPTSSASFGGQISRGRATVIQDG